MLTVKDLRLTSTHPGKSAMLHAETHSRAVRAEQAEYMDIPPFIWRE